MYFPEDLEDSPFNCHFNLERKDDSFASSLFKLRRQQKLQLTFGV